MPEHPARPLESTGHDNHEARGQGASSYGEIFRSTVLVGGSSVILIVLGIVRTKFTAVWLGPSGVGLMAVYTSIVDLASTLSGLGVSSSAVREIAAASAAADSARVAAIVATLRRLGLVLGLAGGVLLAVTAPVVSVLTFGDRAQEWPIAVLGLAVCMTVIAAAHGALLQGTRRVRELAAMRITGALAGTAAGLVLIWRMGEQGIIPLLLFMSVAAAVTACLYGRRATSDGPSWSLQARVLHYRALVGLGLVFMVSAAMVAGVTYAARLIVMRELGMHGLGQFSAAYALSGIYVSFILQSMGTDFYPRLTAVAHDISAANKMINEQTEISLLLAVPGVLLTLTLADAVMAAFYSPQFAPAAVVLRWQVLGSLGRVVSWPLGFALVARGAQRTFLLTEALASALHLGLVLLFTHAWGLQGAGAALFALYVVYTILMLLIGRTQTSFTWSPVVVRLLSYAIPAVAVAFVLPRYLPSSIAMIASCGITLAVSVWCITELLQRLPETTRERLLRTLGWQH